MENEFYLISVLLAKLKIVDYADYDNYLRVSAKDTKLDALLETNNTYRSLLSAIFCVASVWVVESVTTNFPIIEQYKIGIALALIAILLALAYRKQTEYIKNRVEKKLNVDR